MIDSHTHIQDGGCGVSISIGTVASLQIVLNKDWRRVRGEESRVEKRIGEERREA